MAFTKRDTAIILPCLFLLSLALVNAELLPPRELVGKTVILRSTMMQTVAISTKTDAWNDADIVVRVPSGTVAEVIGVSTVRLTHNKDLHWYQVKAMYQGKEYVGWVHETYVHEMASPKPIAPPVAVDVDEKQCAFLLKSYGAGPVASVIRTIRDGMLTIEVKAELREMFGLPDFSFITPRSVCRDFSLSGISLTEFTERVIAQRAVSLQAAARRAEEERREREREQERRDEAERQAEAERRRIAILESGPEGENCRDGIAAYVMSQEFIKERLKAPATAQFPSALSVQTSYLGRV